MLRQRRVDTSCSDPQQHLEILTSGALDSQDTEANVHSSSTFGATGPHLELQQFRSHRATPGAPAAQVPEDHIWSCSISGARRPHLEHPQLRCQRTTLGAPAAQEPEDHTWSTRSSGARGPHLELQHLRSQRTTPGAPAAQVPEDHIWSCSISGARRPHLEHPQLRCQRTTPGAPAAQEPEDHTWSTRSSGARGPHLELQHLRSQRTTPGAPAAQEPEDHTWSTRSISGARGPHLEHPQLRCQRTTSGAAASQEPEDHTWSTRSLRFQKTTSGVTAAWEVKDNIWRAGSSCARETYPHLGLRSQGFLTAVPVLDLAELEGARRSFQKLEEEFGKEHTQYSLHNVHLLHPWVLGLATHPRTLQAITAVLGPNIILLDSRFICKYPASDVPHRGEAAPYVAWHQDIKYWGFEGGPVASAWLALDDVDTENGVLWIIPGSHKQGVLEHRTAMTPGNVLSSNQEIPRHLVDAERAVACPLQAGQMSIHDGRTVHASEPNMSHRRRCGFVIRYVPTTAYPVDRMIIHKEWQRPSPECENEYTVNLDINKDITS
ncbi:hypothetical protein NDU88_007340 [Pleurodeles waltl]|uniref:Uncharacterized protein n=1 Tax=Pleurodeles waltl TaxID=8319 RepID=A0AAV7MJY7_PLEWA|nr:hypothetical protein NDU88_007340 [Pleurodeles waltl]